MAYQNIEVVSNLKLISGLHILLLSSLPFPPGQYSPIRGGIGWYVTVYSSSLELVEILVGSLVFHLLVLHLLSTNKNCVFTLFLCHCAGKYSRHTSSITTMEEGNYLHFCNIPFISCCVFRTVKWREISLTNLRQENEHDRGLKYTLLYFTAF